MSTDDLGRFDDRDLLVANYVKLDTFEKNLEDIKARQNKMDERMAIIEKAQSKASGFLSGANWVVGFLAGGGGSIAGFILGNL